MKRELRTELKIGLLVFATWGVLNQFATPPHFVMGLLIGVSLSLMLVGGLREKRYMALKSFKKRIFGR